MQHAAQHGQHGLTRGALDLHPTRLFDQRDAIFIIGVQQLWAPWGIVKYKQRLKDDEQAWLDLGVSPEQAVTRAYNNMRPPPKVEMKAEDEPQEDAEQTADNESE